MSEGQVIDEQRAPDAEQQQTPRSPNRGGPLLNRRGFLKALGVGAAAAVLGTNLEVPENAVEYFRQEGPLTMVLGNHNTDQDNFDLQKHFRETGDLRDSQWKGKPLDKIRKNMRAAKQAGRPYVCVLDSLNSTYSKDAPRSTRGVMYPWIPEPDLSQEEAYPEDIFMMGADVPLELDYDLEPLQAKITSPSLKALMEEAIGWHHTTSQPSLSEGVQQAAPLLAESVTETALITAFFRAGIPMDRGQFGALVASVGAVEAIKMILRTGVMQKVAGALEDQKVMSILSEAVKYDKDFSVRARTAIAVEKADHLSQNAHHLVNASSTPLPVDLLYGSGHADDLSPIMTDRNHRLTVIRTFATDVLTRFHEAIQQKYPDLQPYHDDILRTVAGSFVDYTIFKLNVPWKKTSVPPNEIANFDNNLLERHRTEKCPKIQPIIGDILQKLGVKESLGSILAGEAAGITDPTLQPADAPQK